MKESILFLESPAKVNQNLEIEGGNYTLQLIF